VCAATCAAATNRPRERALLRDNGARALPDCPVRTHTGTVDVMSRMNTRAIAMLSVLALTAARPAGSASTATSTAAYDLQVRQYDSLSAGEYDGRMRLRISPDGIVSGTFMNTQGEVVSSVTGGLDGTKIWLQIGNGS
jgi:hypothetical protein